MRRKSTNDLIAWIKQPANLRRPLILRGARQVGKSTLVRLVAEKLKIDLIEVNLEKIKLDSINANFDIDINKILLEIELKTGKKVSNNVLLFFDEIQENIHAFSVLRYFYEERPEIPIIAAGSLLEIVLKNNSVTVPVGRAEYYHLGPMTFEEFLMAQKHDQLVEELQKSPLEISSVVFKKLQQHYREYCFIGGMPEAINVFLTTKSYLDVEKVHKRILETYIDDFEKYAASMTEVGLLKKIIRALPLQIGKKVKYSELMPDARHTNVKRALELLEDAKIILRCSHSNCSGIPILSQVDDSVFKIYFLDIGLLNHLLGLDSESFFLDHTENTSNENATLLVEGVIAEQFIAQHLKFLNQKSAANPLIYWLKDKKKSAAEIDFIIQHKRSIIPIEVKAGKSGKLKSLMFFMAEKKLSKAIRFDMQQRSDDETFQKISTEIFNGIEQKKVKFDLTNIPLFLIEYIQSFL